MELKIKDIYHLHTEVTTFSMETSKPDVFQHRGIIITKEITILPMNFTHLRESQDRMNKNHCSFHPNLKREPNLILKTIAKLQLEVTIM